MDTERRFASKFLPVQLLHVVKGAESEELKAVSCMGRESRSGWVEATCGVWVSGSGADVGAGADGGKLF